MQVKILFFARLKRETGVEQLAFEVPDGATIKEVARLFEVQHGVSLKGCMVAVNESYAAPDQELSDGDEVAFLPPVAGGSGTEASTHTDITGEALSLERAAAFLIRPEYGAQAYFVGTVRSPNHGKRVDWIEYEGFAPMARKVMEEAAAKGREKHGELRIFIEHRVGKLLPGEASILIGVASPHRRAALEACDDLIEFLKVHIPVWKHEADEDGAHWVAGQTASETL